MNKKLLQYYSLILLRFQLLNFSEADLVELYNSSGDFSSLLHGIINNMMQEPEFFMINSEILNKIDFVNNELRFKFPTEENMLLGNYILKQINIVRNLSTNIRRERVAKYFINELLLREYVKNGKNKFYYSDIHNILSFDYAAYDCLETKNYDFLFQENKFLSSTNKFLKTCPELYLEDKKRLLATKEIIIDSLNSKNSNQDSKQYKKMAKNTLNNIYMFERS